MFRLRTEKYQLKEVISMLANNNEAIINKLAKNSVKTNKKQYAILFFTIILSAFMLFCVFTIGMTYLNSSRLQNTRLNGAEYDIVTMNGFTSEQLNTLQQNENIRSVGIESYAGFIQSTEYDKTVEIGLLWCDEVFWDNLMSPARTKLDGHYPQNKNELMVTKDILKTCGNENLSVGDSLILTYENNTGVYTDEFVISGIWDGYGDTSAGFVSKAFYDETGYDLKNNGILCIKLNCNYVFPTTIQSIEKSLDFSDRQIFAPTGYIENSFKLLLGICGLALVICLSAYLLIYNILYLSVSGKIRYYGLLQSLGMTKKQLVRFIIKQMILVGILGIFIGNLLGIILCMKLVPYILGILGISTGNMTLQFNPVILIVSIVVTIFSIILGMKKPIQIATKVTPVEATKYRECISNGKRYKKKKGAFFWRMAFEQFKKDKKKTVVVLLSLATSLSVFYCLTTIISSQGERTVLPNYWNADFTSLVEDSPYSNDLHIESQFENMRTIQESQGEMMEIGTIIALLLLLVGVLNYTNTIASSIQNRKLTFSVMESIGMSKKQINQLLIREGVLYALFSVFITLTIGSVITYICFESMNYMEIPFNVPVFPLFSAIILVMLICMITPLLSYKKLAGNRSIVERLRDYE